MQLRIVTNDKRFKIQEKFLWFWIDYHAGKDFTTLKSAELALRDIFRDEANKSGPWRTPYERDLE